jgi:methionine biosynthesis protein MetW
LSGSSDSSSLYQLKRSPYSSHSVLLRLFPAEGNGATVLDVGCGNGYLGAILADRGFRVTGLERSGGYGADFPANVELVEADLEQGLPELSRRFDYVLAADVLEHFRRPERLLQQLRSVMKPGAWLIASFPNSGHFYFRLNVLLGRFPQHDTGLFDRTHVRFYMLDGWRKLLRDTGFAIESWQVTGVPVGLAFRRLADTALIRLAERISYDLARLWKRLFAYQFVVTATAPAPKSPSPRTEEPTRMRSA